MKQKAKLISEKDLKEKLNVSGLPLRARFKQFEKSSTHCGTNAELDQLMVELITRIVLRPVESV